MDESRAQRLFSHPHSSSWRLFSLLWSVSTPSGPPIETRDGKVAMTHMERGKLNYRSTAGFYMQELV